MSAQRLYDLERSRRRRAVLRTVVVILLIWIAVFGAYFLAPDYTGLTDALLQLAAGLVLFAAVTAWQVRRIRRSDLPQLAALEALGMLVAFFVVIFATTYLTLDLDRGTFTEPLDRTAALYFSVTVLTTVGFGDITPVAATARLVTTAQMVLDLVLLAGVVRVVVGAAKLTLRQRDEAE